MADLSDIPAKAVELAARASFVRQSDFDSLSDMGKNIELHQARRMLAAALPVLNTAKDAELAELREDYERMRQRMFELGPIIDALTHGGVAAELVSLRAEVAVLRQRDAEYTASLRGGQ